MGTFRNGIMFASTLENSCLVSRIHPKGVEQPKDYFTLHQIVWKILRRQHNPRIAEKLAGDDMFKHVAEALRRTFATEPTQELVEYYYSLIRSHKNNSQFLKTLPYGSAILTNYQKLLHDNMDWEDSLQTATWYLKNNMVKDLYEFPYQNIILVHPEKLQENRNKNARDFFTAWCTWMEEYTRCNAFLANDFGDIFKFKNGAFESYDHIYNLYHQSESPFDYAEIPYKLTYQLNPQQPSENDGCFF